MSKRNELTEMNYRDLLDEAISEPGMISQAYSTFHGYSLGNQFGVMVQCQIRGIEPGPIAGYKKWQELDRQVQGGEQALGIWIPRPYSYTEEVENQDGEIEEIERQGMTFLWKRCVFVLSQTEGEEYELPATPDWNREQALDNLEIQEISFDLMNGNAQGYAMSDKIAINPVAENPLKTSLHEIAHVIMGHTGEGELSDNKTLARNLKEIEAEATAMIVMAALDQDGIEYSRGYIQGWLGDGNEIPEESAQRIFSTANKILDAGKVQ